MKPLMVDIFFFNQRSDDKVLVIRNVDYVDFTKYCDPWFDQSEYNDCMVVPTEENFTTENCEVASKEWIKKLLGE